MSQLYEESAMVDEPQKKYQETDAEKTRKFVFSIYD